MQLEPARQDDLPAIMALERGEGFETLVGRWEEHAHRQEMENPGSLYLMWRDEAGRSRGFAMLQDLVNPHGSGRLRRIAVDQPGEGVGSALLRTLLAYAFGPLGLHRLDLMVFEGNERARRAYRKCGFVEEGLVREAHRNTDGSYRSLALMSILRPDWQAAI